MTNSLRFALLLLCISESSYEQKYKAAAFERMNVSVLQHFPLPPPQKIQATHMHASGPLVRFQIFLIPPVRLQILFLHPLL